VSSSMFCGRRDTNARSRPIRRASSAFVRLRSRRARSSSWGKTEFGRPLIEARAKLIVLFETTSHSLIKSAHGRSSSSLTTRAHPSRLEVVGKIVGGSAQICIGRDLTGLLRDARQQDNSRRIRLSVP